MNWAGPFAPMLVKELVTLVDMACVPSHSLASLDRRLLSAWLPYTNLNANFGVRPRYQSVRVTIVIRRGSGIEGLYVDVPVTKMT